MELTPEIRRLTNIADRLETIIDEPVAEALRFREKHKATRAAGMLPGIEDDLAQLLSEVRGVIGRLGSIEKNKQ